MPILSLVHTKGGVAKTTSAVYLATAAHRRGINVELIDADPQGSALEWATDAQGDNPLPFPVLPAGRPLTVNADRELTIVDTPPGTAQVIQEAIDIADLVVVPTGASPLDVRRVQDGLRRHRLLTSHAADGRPRLPFRRCDHTPVRCDSICGNPGECGVADDVDGVKTEAPAGTGNR